MTIRSSNVKIWAGIILSVMLAGPAIVLGLSGHPLTPEATIIIFGIAILSASLLLTWGAEVAQLDLSASLSIAILAIIVILPEFAIEWILAWQAGQSPEDPQTIARVAAAVTGSNRLLIGIGWAIVGLIFWAKSRNNLETHGSIRLELWLLGLATIITFLIFPLQQIGLVLGIILISVYLVYLWLSSKTQKESPTLVGPSAAIGALPTLPRRLVVLFLLTYSAIAIFASAKPFIDGLIGLGRATGVDDFILIQWLAPMATEIPEIMVAVIFTLRGNQIQGLMVLISAELNQLALLLGTLPLVYSLSLGQISGINLENQQIVEFLLMSSMSLFAVILIAKGFLPWKGCLILLLIFVTHLFFTSPDIRLIYVFLLIGLTGFLLITDKYRIIHLIKMSQYVYNLSTGNKRNSHLLSEDSIDEA